MDAYNLLVTIYKMFQKITDYFEALEEGAPAEEKHFTQEANVLYKVSFIFTND